LSNASKGASDQDNFTLHEAILTFLTGLRYCSNGPTFAERKDWCGPVLLEGVPVMASRDKSD
jgi:hypothetical protein